jgi:putative ABC transport system permease protein
MLKNHLKIALRNLHRHKSYSLINVAGLAISIAACFLILQYVAFELSYDAFHENAGDLYRLTNDRFQNGALTQHGVITYPSVPKQMKRDYPEILNYTRLNQFGRLYLRRGEIGFDESIVFADSAFFSMFSFPLIVGDAKTALAKPHSILLSESAAEKYFGRGWQERGIVGETFSIDNRFDAVVTGVFEDVPVNSHITFDFLASYKTLGKELGSDYEDSWTNSNFMAYFQLVPGTDAKALEQKFLDFSERYFRGTEVTNSVERFHLQPLQAVHLYSDYEYETWVHGNGTAVWGLLLIAGFILTIAWVNYINLTTARSMERAKEVAVRKVVGARRTELVRQFLFESVVLNVLGFGIALAVVELLQPPFHELLGVHFPQAFLATKLGLLFIAIFITGTFVTGLYPALLHSSFNTILALGGKLAHSSRGRAIRKGLVVFQFAMSFALIAGTYTVYSQLDFMLNKDLGINLDQTLVIRGPRLTNWDSTYFDHVASFKAELRSYPAIGHVTTSQRLPGDRTGRIFNLQRKSGDPQKRYTVGNIGVDHQFFETFEMKILAGRGFSRSDHDLDFNAVKSVVLNATAAKHLGFAKPEEAIGEALSYWNKDWQVIGVVADHHQQSLRVPVEPIVFMPLYSTGNYYFAKVSRENLQQTLALVESKYREFFPGNSFNYFFLDESFNAQYQADRQFGTVFGLFALLGVLLACLGLFGLASFTARQKTKEIGVRKVLGATVANVVSLLAGQFVKLVVLANLLAWPLAYVAMNNWLQGFAYRIDLGAGIFIAAGLSTLLIALLTVSTQAIKAALANPVEALRYE